MTTSFQVDQPSGAGTGVAGEARTDLWQNVACNLSCLSPPPGATFLWEILYAPTGSAAVISNSDQQVAQFTPDVVTRSFRIHLKINQGGVGNDFIFILCATNSSVGAQVNNGWRTPAVNEQGNEANQNGNTLGYAPDYDKIILDIASGFTPSPPSGLVSTGVVTPASNPFQIPDNSYVPCDARTGGIVLKTPTGPSDGDAFAVVDVYGQSLTHPIQIQAQGVGVKIMDPSWDGSNPASPLVTVATLSGEMAIQRYRYSSALTAWIFDI